MATTELRLEEIAKTIVADGRGILAADETPRTLTKRFAAHGIESTPETRRAYREMFFTTPRIGELIGGVILQDETIRQRRSSGQPLVETLSTQGIVPGIKVDAGTQPLAGAPGELVTEGLDGLRSRLQDYRAMGACFAKWRAVIAIAERRPSARAVHANVEALARYAILCQEESLVAIVEPEVLMNGEHTLERCEKVTSHVLRELFDALDAYGVVPERVLLKPSMVVSGKSCAVQAPVGEVASATLRTLSRHVPPAVPAIVFLSGGQDPRRATEHLSAINALPGPKPWVLSFSYGRALQDEALEAWGGRSENVAAAQRAFRHRARCELAAALGRYSLAMEREAA